jgi:hypothetical protein
MDLIAQRLHHHDCDGDVMVMVMVMVMVIAHAQHQRVTLLFAGHVNAELHHIRLPHLQGTACYFISAAKQRHSAAFVTCVCAGLRQSRGVAPARARPAHGWTRWVPGLGEMMPWAAVVSRRMLLLMVVAGFALDLGAKDVQLTLDVAGR